MSSADQPSCSRSTSTTKKKKRTSIPRLTKEQALDLFHSLVVEERNQERSDDEIDLFSDDNDPEFVQPPSKKKKANTGKGKGKRTRQPSPPPDTDSSAESETETDTQPQPGGSRSSVAAETGSRPDPSPQAQWKTVGEGKTVGSSRFRTVQSGVQAPLTAASKQIDCLLTLLTEEIVDDLVDDINSYAEKRIQQSTPMSKRSTFAEWQPATRQDFYRFLAVVIATGMNPRSDIKDYWSTVDYKYTPWFKAMFSRTKFLLMYQSMLHVSEPDARGNAKIEPFINSLIKQYKSSFHPYENLSIDEMVVGFRGRFHARQYNASKPSKYHIKTFGVCDSTTGYAYDLLVYFGANTSYIPAEDPDASHAVKVFSTLLKDLPGKHHLYADRFYTSLPLIDYLKERGMNFTGTVNINRRGLPQQVKEGQMKQGETRWLLKDTDDVLCVQWKDKKSRKACLALSTHCTTTFEERTEGRRDVRKPNPIHSYNMAMNGCDRMDQMVSYYGNHSRKTHKWWKKLFTWILEVTQVNAHLLYTLTHPDADKRVTLADFKHKLIESLIQLSNTDIPADIPSAVLSKPGRKPTTTALVSNPGHLIDYDGADRQCVQCSKEKRRKRTSFYCTVCLDKPHLCAKGCFRAYHLALSG